MHEHLGQTQMGFRRGRNTLMAIFAARRLVEEVRRLHPGEYPVHLVFVDYVKAFDSVFWPALWNILALYRVPRPLVAAIRKLYEGSTASVRTPYGVTPPCPLQTGVWQGCVLSPYLFIIVVDYVMRKARARFARVAGREPGLVIHNDPSTGGNPDGTDYRLAELIYADDTTLIEDTEHVQLWLDCLAIEARAVGLEVSKKTEAMALGLDGPPPPLLLLDGSAVPYTERFKLLGSWLPGTEDDINTRIGLAWTALRKLDRLWRAKDLGAGRKRDLFKVLVLTVLTYGAEAWTLTEHLESRLNGTVTRMLKYILGVRYGERRSLEALYGGMPRVTDVIRQRRLDFVIICNYSRVPVGRPRSTKSPKKVMSPQGINTYNMYMPYAGKEASRLN